MDSQWLSKARDGAITILAVWLAATLAGSTRFLPLPPLAGSFLSLAVYFGLLLIYMTAVGPGRRSGAPAFLAGAFLYPVYFLVLMPSFDAVGYRWVYSLLAAGSAFGFQFSGGADTPAEAYLGPWLLNALIPILIALAARTYIRERACRDSDG